MVNPFNNERIVMKDKKGNELTVRCILQSEIGGKETTKITYKGGGEFSIPGGGTMNHTQESLLESQWVVIDYPKVNILDE